MAVLDGQPARDVDAQGGAEQGRLDVMHGERVPREKHLHEPELDEARQVDAGAGMHHRGAGDHQDPAPGFAHLTHLVGDSRDEDLLRLLGRYLAAHEAEDLRLPGALERRDPHALVPYDDLHAGFCVLEDDAPGAVRLALDGDRGVHLDVVNRDPQPVEQDLGWQVARRVEAFRENPGPGNLVQAHRLLMLRGRAQGARALHDAVEKLGRIGVDLHPADRGIGLVLADL